MAPGEPEAMIKLAPHPDGHLRTDRAVAIQNVNTARHTVVVDVVLTNNAKRDTVVYLTRSHIKSELPGMGRVDSWRDGDSDRIYCSVTMDGSPIRP